MSRPGPETGQERVLEYPRPPAVERTDLRLAVEFAGEVVAETERGLRVLERGHPPLYFFPKEDVRLDRLEPADRRAWCEFKGRTRFHSIRVGRRVAREAAFDYPRPLPEYRALRDHLAFFPGRAGRCTVNGERATPQPGGYYAGWVTRWLEGPFKSTPRLPR